MISIKSVGQGALFAAFIGASAAGSSNASAEDFYKDKTVRMIISSTVGGG